MADAQTCTPPCWARTSAEIAAGVTPTNTSYPPGDVRRYGALGDGVANDAPAIQNAIDAAPANAAVYLPPNAASQVYKLNTGLTITKPIRFIGSGPLQTTLYANGFSSGSSLLHVDGTVNPNLEFVEVSDLTLMSSNNSPDLLKVNRASNSAFRDLGLRNGRYGLVITGNRTFSNLYERLICVTTPLDNTVRFDSYTGGGNHTFVGCSFGGTYGLVIDTNSDVSGLTLLSCNFEGTTNEGLYCVGGIQGLNLSGCRFEKCNAFVDVRIDPAVGKVGYGIEIHGCYFETDAASFAVQFGGQGAPVRGFHVSGNYAQDYSSGFVRLNGDGESGLVCGNRLQNVSAVVNVVRTGVLVVNNENQLGKMGAVWNPALTAAAYTASNVTTDRSYNATATSTAELANVLGTLIADLRAIGLIQ
jgi:hypothetical protein